jgi:hypothetical protein
MSILKTPKNRSKPLFSKPVPNHHTFPSFRNWKQSLESIVSRRLNIEEDFSAQSKTEDAVTIFKGLERPEPI